VTGCRRCAYAASRLTLQVNVPSTAPMASGQRYIAWGWAAFALFVYMIVMASRTIRNRAYQFFLVSNDGALSLRGYTPNTSSAASDRVLESLSVSRLQNQLQRDTRARHCARCEFSSDRPVQIQHITQTTWHPTRKTAQVACSAADWMHHVENTRLLLHRDHAEQKSERHRFCRVREWARHRSRHHTDALQTVVEVDHY